MRALLENIASDQSNVRVCEVVTLTVGNIIEPRVKGYEPIKLCKKSF